MQIEKQVLPILEKICSPEQYVFSVQDFSPLFPAADSAYLKTLVNRLAKRNVLKRICKGIYAYKPDVFSRGFLLFHVAAKLRQSCFNYVSLETALSEYGIISQIMFDCVTVMTSGRGGVVLCGTYGKIEFVHTEVSPEKIFSELEYDERYLMYRAGERLAYSDMIKTRRSTIDLVQLEVLRDFV